MLSHLTNFSLNKKSEKFNIDQDELSQMDLGHKRNALQVIQEMARCTKLTEDQIKDEVVDICRKTVIALQPYLVHMFHTQMGVGTSNKNCFHIFGIDILFDQQGKGWLMEINASPSMNMYTVNNSEDDEEAKVVLSKLDQQVKTLAISDAIKIM